MSEFLYYEEHRQRADEAARRAERGAALRRARGEELGRGSRARRRTRRPERRTWGLPAGLTRAWPS